MFNKFYQPKNEFGELLASKQYVNTTVEEVSRKLDNFKDTNIGDLSTLETTLKTDYTNQFNELKAEIKNVNDRPFNIEFIDNDISIEAYIQNAWNECKSIEEKRDLKIKIGNTLYLRKTSEGENEGYEEYICKNPRNIRPEDDAFSPEVKFNRLGSAEATLGSINRHGSVKLEYNIYNNTAEEWNNYTVAEQINGINTNVYLPKDGLAVAPCALYDFYKADDELRKDLSEKSGRLETAESKIKDINEFLGLIESGEGNNNNRLDILEKSNNAQEERLTISESDIAQLKRIVGVDEKCPNCGKDNCSSIPEIDCSVVCKLNDLQYALNDNSEQITIISESSTAANNKIDTLINEDLGARPSNSPKLWEQIASLQNEISNNSKLIGERPKDGSVAEDLWTQTKGIGIRPVDGTYAETLWEQAKTTKKSVTDIETLVNTLNEVVNKLAKQHSYNTIVLECDLPKEEDNGPENIEATVAIPYSYITEIIERTTGTTISPSDLTIIFNGARCTVDSNEDSAEHIYPEINYDGVVDTDNNSHRALVLTFAGYNKVRHVLISLSYYNNKLIQPSKTNIIRIK